VTALFAATIALKQWDIKRVLAYSTISQLGYMFVGVGAGAAAAGLFHLTTHAFFKALLFLGAGSVIHAMHRAYHATHAHDDAQDMRNMGGLKRWLPWTAGLMWLATLAIAGIPPLSGFFSKDEILASAFGRGPEAPLFYVIWGVGTVAALMTAFYMTRMMLYTFHGPNRTGETERSHLHEAPWVMTGPLVVLGAGAALGGLLNLPEILPGAGWLEHWLEPVTSAGDVYRLEAHLAGGTEWALLGLATLVALGGMGLAWRVLRPEGLRPAAEAPPETGFEKILLKKWYVDEIYDGLVVRPLVWVSDRVLWKRVDDGLIDAVGVNGSARVARGVGAIGSWLQTGQVGTYVFFFVVGVLLLLRAVIRT
jgi:NADH-quinone oxidoreductase subunit L